MGAVDFLVKPVRLQECKAFVTKMKRREIVVQPKVQLERLAKY